MAVIIFNAAEKESYNKKLVRTLSRIVLGMGYIITAGEIIGYEKKNKAENK